MNESTVNEIRISVTAVKTVRTFRFRRLEMPNTTAANVALSRPTSASCTPEAACFIFPISCLNFELIIAITTVPIAKITNAKKIT